MKINILAASLLVLATTTASAGFLQDAGINQYGQTKIEKSDFDGLTTISVSPAYVRNKDSKFSWPAPFRLGLYWSQKFPQLIALVVEMDGVTNITSLESKIGDDITSYPTSDNLPDWHRNKASQTVSSKAFAISLDQLKKLMDAEKVMLRVNGVHVGYFHVETSSLDPTAKKAIAKILPNIAELQPKETTASLPTETTPENINK